MSEKSPLYTKISCWKNHTKMSSWTCYLVILPSDQIKNAYVFNFHALHAVCFLSHDLEKPITTLNLFVLGHTSFWLSDQDVRFQSG